MSGGTENLKPARSKAEARERGAKGGKASGESRRRRKALKEHLELLLTVRHGDVDGGEALAVALFEKPLSGDVRAFECIRDTIGEKPDTKINLSPMPEEAKPIRVVFVDARDGSPAQPAGDEA